MLSLAMTVGCSDRSQSRALDRRSFAAQRLAEEVARRVPGSHVLVIGNPFTQLPGQKEEIGAFEEAAVRGIRDGLRKQGASAGVAYPELRPGVAADPTSADIPPNATTPLSFMTAPGAWDQLAAKHPEANVWISLIGVPADVQSMQSWSPQSRLKFALLLPDLRLLGDFESVKAAFVSGKVVAAVLPRPSAPSESQAAASSSTDDFALRFVLLTADNLEATQREFPKLFP